MHFHALRVSPQLIRIQYKGLKRRGTSTLCIQKKKNQSILLYLKSNASRQCIQI